jgi:N-acetylneuraminate synthase
LTFAIGSKENLMAKKEIKIGNHIVGDGHPVFMIAEIGINHNGDMQIAKKLIDGAFVCNWHCVKFQKRTPEICVPEAQKNVMRDTPWGRIPYIEYRKKIEFGEEQYRYIDSYCKEKPILWSASVWDIPSLEFLMEYDVPFIKIPSAKLTEDKLLIESAKTAKPIILSTGMSTLEELDHAVEILEKHSKGNYILMHTNSAYPAPIEELNLNLISFLKERYNCIVGYSGHEYDLEPSVVAVAMGAKVLERHVTLNHNMWGSDQSASLEVHAMDFLFRRIANIDVMLGDGGKRITASERPIREKLRGK